jgi:predicted transposase YdaD
MIELRAMNCQKWLELPSIRGSSSSRWLMGGTTMANLDSVHDKLCWTAFEDVKDAVAELRSVLPKGLVERLDWLTLAPLPERFVDEVMRGSQADRLYQARYGDSDALVYVLWEHKSDVDKWTLLQLLRYMVRIWEHCLAKDPPPLTLPPIIPVIIHHSETGWTATTRFQGLFESTLMVDEILQRLTPSFEVVIDDISHRTDAELRARALGPMALLALLFLRDGRREGRILEELPDWADLVLALWNSPNGRRAILQLFSYLMRVAPNLSLPELESKVRQVIPETEELVMTLAEQLIEQGRNEVFARQRSLVRRQMELKFGALTAEAEARINAADQATLEDFANRVLFASSLADIFRD